MHPSCSSLDALGFNFDYASCHYPFPFIPHSPFPRTPYRFLAFAASFSLCFLRVWVHVCYVFPRQRDENLFACTIDFMVAVICGKRTGLCLQLIRFSMWRYNHTTVNYEKPRNRARGSLLQMIRVMRHGYRIIIFFSLIFMDPFYKYIQSFCGKFYCLCVLYFRSLFTGIEVLNISTCTF